MRRKVPSRQQPLLDIIGSSGLSYADQFRGLPERNMLDGFQFRLRLTINHTTGGGGTYTIFDLLDSLNGITLNILGESRKVFNNVSMRDIAESEILKGNIPMPFGAVPTLPLTPATGTGNYDYDIIVTYQFGDPRLLDERDFIPETGAYEQAQFRVNFPNFTLDANNTITAFELDIFALVRGVYLENGVVELAPVVELRRDDYPVGQTVIYPQPFRVLEQWARLSTTDYGNVEVVNFNFKDDYILIDTPPTMAWLAAQTEFQFLTLQQPILQAILGSAYLPNIPLVRLFREASTKDYMDNGVDQPKLQLTTAAPLTSPVRLVTRVIHPLDDSLEKRQVQRISPGSAIDGMAIPLTKEGTQKGIPPGTANTFRTRAAISGGGYGRSQ